VYLKSKKKKPPKTKQKGQKGVYLYGLKQRNHGLVIQRKQTSVAYVYLVFS